jgi:hypothetical protein
MEGSALRAETSSRRLDATTRQIFILSILFILSQTGRAQSLVPTAVKAVKHLRAAPLIKQASQLIAKPQVVATNPRPVAGIWLVWSPPTNACYVFTASTNLQNWYAKTNVPVTATNVFIPANGNLEFYRGYTALPALGGAFLMQSLPFGTNAP